jgi:hypothetical protein
MMMKILRNSKQHNSYNAKITGLGKSRPIGHDATVYQGFVPGEKSIKKLQAKKEGRKFIL